MSDSSGVTVAANKLNYDPASPEKRKVPITCFQRSSGFINDAKVVDELYDCNPQKPLCRAK